MLEITTHFYCSKAFSYRDNLLSYDLVLKHYSNPLVREEIAAYCSGRWVALEGGGPASRVFLRYAHNGKPLKVSKPEDLEGLLATYKGVRPRTVYGSINVYRRLEEERDLDDPHNIALCSPIWDVDGELSSWKQVLEAAGVIAEFLEQKGVRKSVFIKWSGEGCHVHIHERAFSSDLLSKHNPLDVAFSIVEYTLRALKDKLMPIVMRSNGKVKVENEIDIKRVFTAPLSLHRRHDLCCVCFKLNALDQFDVSWANLESFKHDVSWKGYVEGEADNLAIEALAAVGGYRGWAEGVKEAKATSIALEEKPQAAKIGRFQVMALLQAARYYLLTGDLDKAKSFGLNRAIFYAWAKHHARDVKAHLAAARAREAEKEEKEARGAKLTQVCGEEVFVTDSGWFTMGGVVQTPKDYDRQIALNISSVIPYEEAWKAAIEYLKSFPQSYLQDQQKFFNEVYKPVRDSFIDVVVKKKRGAHKTLDEIFKQFK